MVIARNSSFVFKGKVADVKEIGRKLGVGYVVEGSVRKAGKRVRVTAQLVEAATGAHLWAEKYDRDLDDIFAVQDEVVEQVTWRVAGKVSQAEIGSAGRRGTTSADVYDLYLTGLAHLNRLTPEDSAKAVALLEHAIALDPNFGRAYSALARAQIMWANAEIMPGSLQAYQAGLAAGLKSLEMEDADESAHAEVGHLYNLLLRPDQAKSHLDRAVALNPNNPMTVFYKAYDLMYRGDAEGALTWLDRALRLDPMDPPWIHEALGWAYYALGRYGESVQAFTRMRPRFGYQYSRFAAALAQLGRLDEARRHIAEALRLNPGYTQRVFASEEPGQPSDMEHWLDGLRKAGMPE
jgi:tetratricopeptide (TPR) repeat protein